MKIDAVIPWVDGNDPVLNAKRNRYGDSSVFRQANVAGDTRYANVGEIFWCVASVNRFAPWINKIYIVTDGQDPNLTPFLEKHFPEGYIPVEIVDHKDIFKGYEEYLPTFNSISIETMIWRIPGLSEHFICFNDDFIITAPVTQTDFFTSDGGVVCVADRCSTLLARVLLALKPKKNGVTGWSFKRMMLAASDLAGGGRFFLRVNHTPRGLLKSYYENFYAEHPDQLIRNIRYRFRDNDQYYFISLLYEDLYRQGRCRIEPVDKYLFYLMPKPKPGYVQRKMKKLNNRSYKFCCFNSLDLAAEEEQDMIIRWIENKLKI